MKNFYIALFLFFSSVSLYAQTTVKMSAVKSNDYGVAYTLPKTVLKVKADARKRTKNVGEFYEYAERYLNIANPITNNETIFTLLDIQAIIDGVPNTDERYLVEFKSGSTAPYVTLTKDGLICAINSDVVFKTQNSFENAVLPVVQKNLSNPNIFLTEETLRAGSKAKQAELVAKQIFKLRETKSNILSGEADNMPPDGNAYKVVMDQIDEQEKVLISMFVGTESSEYLSKEFSIAVPVDKNITNQIIFRFSKKLGFVSSEDLSGDPVKLSLTSNLAFKEAPILTPREQKDLEKKFSQGIIYNIPGKAELTIDYANKTWVKKECDIVQYGTRDVLSPKMFENNKQPVKIIFFPELGAIKQIIQ